MLGELPSRLIRLMKANSFSIDQIWIEGWLRSPLTWATHWSRQFFISASLSSEPPCCLRVSGSFSLNVVADGLAVERGVAADDHAVAVAELQRRLAAPGRASATRGRPGRPCSCASCAGSCGGRRPASPRGDRCSPDQIGPHVPDHAVERELRSLAASTRGSRTASPVTSTGVPSSDHGRAQAVQVRRVGPPELRVRPRVGERDASASGRRPRVNGCGREASVPPGRSCRPPPPSGSRRRRRWPGVLRSVTSASSRFLRDRRLARTRRPHRRRRPRPRRSGVARMPDCGQFQTG